jgi:8-amino-7-oxononanoate synthase
MEHYIEQVLEKRKRQGLYRSLVISEAHPGFGFHVNGKDYINFSSNDYLSLSLSLQNAAEYTNYPSGTAGSRLMTGNRALHAELEKKTAEFKKKPEALVFNSGYQANVGVISSLVEGGDVIFSDKLNHASILDGIRLSGAKFYRFKHNDTAHLKSLLKKYRGEYRHSLIITETVFSMDGDMAPLKDMVRLKKDFDSLFMVDEAHATGIFGETGSGVAEQMDASGDIDIIMGTYSKALAGFGAYIACSEKMKEYLVNFCRSFIYSTSLPEPIIHLNLRSLERVRDENFRRKRLLENSRFLRHRLKEMGFESGSETQIIPVIFKQTDKALAAAEELKHRGYWVTAIRPPTVPRGESRIRLSLTYAHDRELLEKFTEDLKEIAEYAISS